MSTTNAVTELANLEAAVAEVVEKEGAGAAHVHDLEEQIGSAIAQRESPAKLRSALRAAREIAENLRLGRASLEWRLPGLRARVEAERVADVERREKEATEAAIAATTAVHDALDRFARLSVGPDAAAVRSRSAAIAAHTDAREARGELARSAFAARTPPALATLEGPEYAPIERLRQAVRDYLVDAKIAADPTARPRLPFVMPREPRPMLEPEVTSSGKTLSRADKAAIAKASRSGMVGAR